MRFFLTTLLLCSCLTGSVLAEFTTAKLFELDQKLRPLLAPYGDKVGVCFIDLETKRELQVNGHKLFPAASVAKLPVMATAYHLAEVEALDLDASLVRLMIVRSDDKATKMLVSQIGLKQINNYLKTKLGLKGTMIVDSTMLNEPSAEAANLTTPADMAQLVVLIENSAEFSQDSSQAMLSYLKKQRNRRGNLDGVLNNVGVVYSPSGKYVLSIFTYGLAKKKDARELIDRISRLTYQTYTFEAPKEKS
jgi:beta-lactamase class A